MRQMSSSGITPERLGELCFELLDRGKAFRRTRTPDIGAGGLLSRMSGYNAEQEAEIVSQPREHSPVSLAPLSFEEVVRALAATPPITGKPKPAGYPSQELGSRKTP
jgi:hypothetical protein